jgi:hypothetical protein
VLIAGLQAVQHFNLIHLSELGPAAAEPEGSLHALEATVLAPLFTLTLTPGMDAGPRQHITADRGSARKRAST